MRVYNRQHRHECGIDLHVKTMYVCILDGTGQVLVHRNELSMPATLLEVVAPYGDDLGCPRFRTKWSRRRSRSRVARMAEG